LELLNNDVHHNRCYGFYAGSSNTVFDGNRIYDNGQYGIRWYCGDGCISNIVICNNIAYNNGFRGQYQAPGILIGSGANNLVYNNVVYGNAAGIQIGFSAGRNKAFSNTMYQNGSFCVEIGSASDTEFRNNICHQNGGEISNQGSNTTLSNNLTSDPLFTNPSAGDFHLQSSSPARDAGVSLPEVPCDFDGNTRPAGSAYDIGAYEYGGTPGSGCSKGGGATPTPPSTSSCTQYTSSSQIPLGFGVTVGIGEGAPKPILSVIPVCKIPCGYLRSQ
jgi:parallel beta-helix repeat protein